MLRMPLLDRDCRLRSRSALSAASSKSTSFILSERSSKSLMERFSKRSIISSSTFFTNFFSADLFMIFLRGLVNREVPFKPLDPDEWRDSGSGSGSGLGLSHTHLVMVEQTSSSLVPHSFLVLQSFSTSSVRHWVSVSSVHFSTYSVSHSVLDTGEHFCCQLVSQCGCSTFSHTTSHWSKAFNFLNSFTPTNFLAKRWCMPWCDI